MSTPPPPASSGTFSASYLLAPQAGCVAVLTLTSGSFSATTTVTTVSVGQLGVTPGASLTFTIYNSSAYAEGYVTLQYPTGPKSSLTAECHLNFFLSATGAGWAQDTSGSFPADNTTILPSASTGSTPPILLAPTQPTGGSGGSGIDSLYQVLNPEVVFLVDKRTNGNMLFRGNTPFAAPTTPNGPQAVDFAGLDALMRKRYALQCPDDPTGFPALGAYVLRDICIQSPASEGGSILMELNGFLPAGTTPGSVPISQIDQQWYPPNSSTATVLRQMANWSIEPHLQKANAATDLATAKQLGTWMETTETLPHIYYIHCASGHDRTGILASSYLIVSRKMSLEKAFICGTTIRYVPPAEAGGQIHTNCVDLDLKGHPADTARSRLLLIAPIYNHTVREIYNLVNPTTPVSSFPAEADQTDPAYVYSKYPWQF